MESTNFYIEQKEKQHHHWLLPESIRCVVVGPSGCGKTNVLLKKGYLNFDRFHLYSKSLGQEKYQFLRAWAASLEEDAGKEVASFHDNSDNIIPVEGLDLNERSTFVFDDVMLEKQGSIEKYLNRGRHGGADCFYLTKNYYCIPKQAIRDNANLFVIFAEDGKNARSIRDSFVGGNKPYEEFHEFCRQCWDQPHGFAVIDMTRRTITGSTDER